MTIATATTENGSEMRTDAAAHWDASYESRGTDEVSWFESSPRASLRLIEHAGLGPTAPIIDVGGGASRLAAELLARGFRDVTVADISSGALEAARAEQGSEGARVQRIEADVRTYDFGRQFDLWHDRAVFHFMVESADRSAYLANLRRHLAHGGYLVLATFGPDGPTSCSGLPVQRYDADQMAVQLGDEFEPLDQELMTHLTPRGGEQQFQYALFRRQG